ncbi:DNA-binding protein, partial [Pseudaeromonas pectinilytica]
MNDYSWFTAQELAGLPGLPASDRVIRIRAKKENWTSRPKNEGKGIEFHISSFSPATQAALLRKHGKVQVGDRLIDLPKPKAPRYCKEVLWARWGQAGATAQAKAQQKLDAVLAVQGLIKNSVSKMEAFASIAREFAIPQPTLLRWHYAVQKFEQADWLPLL